MSSSGLRIKQRKTIIHQNSYYPFIKNLHLKALLVKNSVLHDFGFGKVSRVHETFLMELQLFGWRHFSKIEVMQNSVLTLISLISVEVGINVKGVQKLPNH